MIPRKAYWIGGGVVALILAISLWFAAHNARIRREAVAKAATERLVKERQRVDSVNVVLRDSLRIERVRTDTVKIVITAAAENYQRERGKVDLAAPQPAGVPAGHVVVPVSYVQAADSVAKLVPVLTNRIESERITYEARIDGLVRADSLSRAINEQLRIQIKAAGPGVTGRLKWAGVGALVTLGAVAILKN
jgi:hypothetical protein